MVYYNIDSCQISAAERLFPPGSARNSLREPTRIGGGTRAHAPVQPQSLKHQQSVPASYMSNNNYHEASIADVPKFVAVATVRPVSTKAYQNQLSAPQGGGLNQRSGDNIPSVSL